MADKKRRETKYSEPERKTRLKGTPMAPARKTYSCDIAIIGAGAAGLAAAISASEANAAASVIVLDKNDVAGRKIRATGNGRCNITNEMARDSLEVREFLAMEGIAVKTIGESGLMYPVSESANDVADALYDRATRLGVRFLMGAEVSSVGRNTAGGFEIKGRSNHSQYDVNARKVIVAAGGKAGPVYGTTGDAYKWMREMGHNVISPIPVLTPVECEGDDCAKLSGIRAKSLVKLRKNGDTIYEADGEVQFTKFGLSGICIFNATRHMRYDRSEGISVYSIELDLVSDMDIDSMLAKRIEIEAKYKAERNSYKAMSVRTFLMTIVKDKLAEYILERAGISGSREITELASVERESLTDALRCLAFHPTGIRGWKEAQCTSGGVALEEVSEETYESAVIPGMYITGELLDYDGPCGGYNLNHAILSGKRAGTDASRGI